MASTAQEALIAELLGDIGRLHDQIKALPESLGSGLAQLNRAQSDALERIERQNAAMQRLEAVTRQLAAARASEKPGSTCRCGGWLFTGLILGGALARLVW